MSDERQNLGGPGAGGDFSPTLEDVAARAKVSTATVSRCLNTPERVSEATRERVMEAVRALGYAPNFGARALAANRTNTFGAIIPTMENAIFARGLQAFQEELGRHGITLLVASSSYSPELEEEQIRALAARGAEAILLIGTDRTPESYTLLQRRKIPHVIAWTSMRGEGQYSIGFDNRKAMEALTAKVLEAGHRRLALISAPRAGNDRARERAEGVVQAMQAHGLPPKALTLIETPYSISNGAEAFAGLMAGATRPTAVMCGNDVLAAGALRQARSMGISVPKDVSVTGFDDIEIAEIVSPALTTVHVPHRAMGAGAARKLMALRNGETVAESEELPATIMWRDSLGPVRAG
ncbi:LacI family DNA-binding transcriptional regulator [Pseudoruegeria sp. SHC-113]|uniref:LacI family DNA-binding transcriptional regulator n=1 Tax=Pseudoruegeria sp. SHC-113 TaxID=2855439 RepID=UPI0021BAA3AB|nr:LacI family DNA-binding transcriptional regulator [Pseudoruegeria sp. SHC-113]MCT8159496.1 LacI family DNA-binding transcriptional regulator [Pseudoruegeria sp. SHC-113]